jgi:hypothetical protein
MYEMSQFCESEQAVWCDNDLLEGVVDGGDINDQATHENKMAVQNGYLRARGFGILFISFGLSKI